MTELLDRPSNQSVPFFANTPDGNNCFQAALRSVLKHFQPERDFTLQELEVITAKKDKEYWTWPYAGAAWMIDQGFEVKDIEIFDNGRFVAEGVAYLREFMGPEVANAQIAHADIEQERALGKVFLEKVHVQLAIPDRLALRKLLREGFLIICNINSSVLEKKAGYNGHFVVVTAMTDLTVTFHDPGPPGHENRRVSHSKFERAWAYPTQKAKNILAFRYKRASSS